MCHRAPADQHISWPTDPHAAAGRVNADDDSLVGAPRLPPASEAYDFVVTHSAPDDPELLSGLCMYAEVFLATVGMWAKGEPFWALLL